MRLREDGDPGIQVIFTEEGGKQFAELTERYKGRRIGILVRGKLMGAPSIMSPIYGGSGEIAGNFTKAEADELANKLNSLGNR